MIGSDRRRITKTIAAAMNTPTAMPNSDPPSDSPVVGSVSVMPMTARCVPIAPTIEPIASIAPTGISLGMSSITAATSSITPLAVAAGRPPISPKITCVIGA
ncbi:MAG: hypothetical protein AAGF47_05340 [Planctomycetota bacterium]